MPFELMQSFRTMINDLILPSILFLVTVVSITTGVEDIY